MIHELNGDILFSGAKSIVHSVAPNDDYHQGLALQLRKRLPALYKDFRQHCQIKRPKSGELWAWKTADTRFIVSLFTRDGAYNHGSKPGHASLSHVNRSLHALRSMAQKEKLSSIALPRIACGVGGLNWNEVRPLIDKQLGDLDIPVYIYLSYQKGVKAIEPAK